MQNQAAAAQSCTLYVAANGSSSASGASPTSPLSLLGAAKVAVAGDVVCIAPGTYQLTSTLYPAHSGNPNAWITYTAYGSGPVDIAWAGGGTGDSNMVHMYNATFADGPSYLIFNGLTLDGKNVAENGFFCDNSTHLKYTNNTVINQGSSGIGSVFCDYQTADHNVVFHNGYVGGWSSGISFNSNKFFDQYPGFHNYVTNNYVSGSFDGSSNHTDGNGIIMDLNQQSYVEGVTPNVLIANNVVYGNGGRCIEINFSSNAWVLNNTCYDNVLDLTLGRTGEIVNSYSNTSYYVNNIVSSWDNEMPYNSFGLPKPTGLAYSNNIMFGGSNAGTPSTGFTNVNPVFVNPPAYNPTAGGQYANAINPASLGSALELQATSPAINAGIDPTTLTTNANLINDMSPYLYEDINGVARLKGGPFTLGAYSVGSTTPLPPTSYQLTVAAAGTGTGIVTSSPSGISCGSSCSASYASGTAVTLAAAPNAGSNFSGWSGACSGTSTCSLTLTANISVTATFAATPPPPPPPSTTATPVFSLASGTYYGHTSTMLTDGTAGAAINWCYIAPGRGNCVPSRAYTSRIYIGASETLCANATSSQGESATGCVAYVVKR